LCGIADDPPRLPTQSHPRLLRHQDDVLSGLAKASGDKCEPMTIGKKQRPVGLPN
jgi:hypothetical protein